MKETTPTTSIIHAVAWIILLVGILGLTVGVGYALFSPGTALLGAEPLLIAGFGGLYVAVGAALLWRLRTAHNQPTLSNTDEKSSTPPLSQTPAPSNPDAAKPSATPALVPPLSEILPEKSAALRGDDFTMIEGIGLKVQDVLYQAGITTYTQLAASEVETLLELFKGKRRVPVHESTIATWPRQAQYLVDGDLTGLETFQATLPKSRG